VSFNCCQQQNATVHIVVPHIAIWYDEHLPLMSVIKQSVRHKAKHEKGLSKSLKALLYQPTAHLSLTVHGLLPVPLQNWWAAGSSCK